MVNISGLYSHTQIFPERSRMCADCDKKETGCTRASASDTLDLYQVSDGGHGCVQAPRKVAEKRSVQNLNNKLR